MRRISDNSGRLAVGFGIMSALCFVLASCGATTGIKGASSEASSKTVRFEATRTPVPPAPPPTHSATRKVRITIPEKSQ